MPGSTTKEILEYWGKAMPGFRQATVPQETKKGKKGGMGLEDTPILPTVSLVVLEAAWKDIQNLLRLYDALLGDHHELEARLDRAEKMIQIKQAQIQNLVPIG